jgi:hypothetical protein
MDLRQIVSGMLDANSRGDLAATMAYYHEGVLSSGDASCDKTPCNKAAIEADNRETIRDLKPTFKVVSMRESQTGMGYGKVEMRSDVLRQCGVSRVVLDFSVIILDEKIWRETVNFDRADVETAKLMACFQVGAGMMPRTTPPRTGDGPLG